MAGDAPRDVGWWVAQLTFFFSGMYLELNQTYWGGNSPFGFLNAVAQYFGMAVFGWVFIQADANALHPIADLERLIDKDIYRPEEIRHGVLGRQGEGERERRRE